MPWKLDPVPPSVTRKKCMPRYSKNEFYFLKSRNDGCWPVVRWLIDKGRALPTAFDWPLVGNGSDALSYWDTE